MGIGSCQFSLLNIHIMQGDNATERTLALYGVSSLSSSLSHAGIFCSSRLQSLSSFGLEYSTACCARLCACSIGFSSSGCLSDPKHILFPLFSIPVCVMPSMQSPSWNPGHHPLLIPVPSQSPGHAHFIFLIFSIQSLLPLL